jgi:hypothetical protein
MSIAPDSINGMVTGPRVGNRSYSDEEKLSAVTLYVLTGNMEEVCRRTGFPSVTLHGWKHSEWWDRSLTDVRREHIQDLDGKFTDLIDSAMLEVKDRLLYGDEKTTAKGVRYRQKVSAKDASVVAAVFYDKRQIGRSLPTSISGNQGEGLAAMLQEFRALADKLDAKTIDSDGHVIEPDSEP